jgi:hypothetical protein
LLPSSELGLPQPFTRRRVCPPLWYQGEGHTRWREREWEGPNSDDWRKSLALCLLCGSSALLLSERLSRFSALLTNSKQNTDKVCKQQQKMVKETMAQDLTPFYIFPFLWLISPGPFCHSKNARYELEICKSANVTIIIFL